MYYCLLWLLSDSELKHMDNSFASAILVQNSILNGNLSFLINGWLDNASLSAKFLSLARVTYWPNLVNNELCQDSSRPSTFDESHPWYLVSTSYCDEQVRNLHFSKPINLYKLSFLPYIGPIILDVLLGQSKFITAIKMYCMVILCTPCSSRKLVVYKELPNLEDFLWQGSSTSKF